jgi:hypothetical protein
MAHNPYDITWLEKIEDVIVLHNRTKSNYVLDLPSGRVRLDAGRRIRTVRTILKIEQVKDLLDRGMLVLE